MSYARKICQELIADREEAGCCRRSELIALILCGVFLSLVAGIII